MRVTLHQTIIFNLTRGFVSYILCIVDFVVHFFITRNVAWLFDYQLRENLYFPEKRTIVFLMTVPLLRLVLCVNGEGGSLSAEMRNLLFEIERMMRIAEIWKFIIFLSSSSLQSCSGLFWNRHAQTSFSMSCSRCDLQSHKALHNRALLTI